MPGLLKVGMSTKIPEERARELSSDTGVPTRYIVEYYSSFDDMRIAEREAHRSLKQYHYNKEFFKITVPRAIHAIENLGIPFTRHYSKIDNDVELKDIEQKSIIKKQLEYVAREQRRGEELRKNKKECLNRKRIDEKRTIERRRGLKVGVNLFLLFIWIMGSILFALEVDQTVGDASVPFINNLFVASLTIGMGIVTVYGVLKLFTPLYRE